MLNIFYYFINYFETKNRLLIYELVKSTFLKIEQNYYPFKSSKVCLNNKYQKYRKYYYNFHLVYFFEKFHKYNFCIYVMSYIFIKL